jgi:beta-glucosidase
MTETTRRAFMKTAAGTAIAAGATGCSTESPQPQPPATATPAAAPGPPSAAREFPKGFLGGAPRHRRTRSEGAWNEDGKGESIWDRYAHTPGKIRNNDTGDVANDHYHRYKEDVALMKRDLGATAYRFSISWPRIFPQGTGQPNAKSLDFYSRLVDELRANGIEPFATLYHWDLPQALQDKGGWESRDIPKAFADYAGYVAGKLGDRVGHFFTINEFRSFTEGAITGSRSPLRAGPEPSSSRPGFACPPPSSIRFAITQYWPIGLRFRRLERRESQASRSGRPRTSRPPSR